jgi:hypothetical protein
MVAICWLLWLVFGVVSLVLGVVLELGCTSVEELEHAAARIASSMSIKATHFFVALI